MPSGAASRACCGPRCARSSCSESITGPMPIRWRSSTERTRGAISVYARGDDYHDVIKMRLKQLGRWLIDRAGGDVKVFVDTAPVMEKPLAAGGRYRLAGQAYQSGIREFGSWLFLGAIFTTLELPPDAPETRSLRPVPRLPGHLPDGSLSRALPARCAALHLLPHHRAQRARSRANCVPRWAIASMAATIAWRSVHGTSSRSRRPRSETRGARGAARAAACRTRRGSTMPRSAPCSPKAPVKRIGRDRFVRNVLIAIGNSGDASSGCRSRAAAR